MNKTFIILGITILALGCKPKYDEVSPKIAPVTEAVFASGIIEPKDAYMLTSLYDGYIMKSYVVENDLVRDGQMLFRLDNRQQRTQVQIAETNLRFAKISAAQNSPNLLQQKALIDAARVKMQNDSLTLNRMQHLVATNSVAKQDVDNARMTYLSSVSNYNAAMESYRTTQNKVTQDEINSQSQLKNAEEANQYYDLNAIGGGKVYQIFKKQGDLVRKGDQVAQLGNPDSIVITLDVDEGSIGKVKLGQQVLVELNTEKNKTHEATVSKIYPHFNEQSQSYKVEARFLQEMPGLISGTQLQANIVTNKKENALLIPHIYLLPGNKVLVKKEKQIDTAVIKTGIVAEDWVEVLEGLTVNDKIAKRK